ncbi:hypothetical protein DYB32_002836 [Aphanomyces invadans]|uniref:Uncharacterized protein n=1 Tax=Aphanomyces invadans TaxID=157072 RepID=A0A418B239_9STRA|nr:hypothetical protein DYB32_002836 [Aphanomyces invadans]
MDPPAREREFVVPVDFRMQEETYQEKLAVQHEEITFLKSYIEKLLNQLRRVLVKHNELEQLQTLCDPTTACVTDEGEDSSMVPPPWFTSKEYMSPLFAAYEGRIKELNNLLVEQRSLVESELEECQRDIHERDSQLLTMSQNFNQASVAIQELRDACNHLKLEKQKCEVQLQQFAATIAQLEAQKETIASRVTGLQTNATNYVKQIDEYERTLANLKLAAEQKQATVTKRYQGVCERLRELTSALDAKHKQVDEWQRHRGVVAELDLVKQDCEGMVKVMHSMEKQLNEYAAREEAVAEAETAEARATSLLAAKEAQFQKTLADLQDKLAIEHEQLSSVQRELDLRRAELRDSQESNAAKEKQVALLTNEVQDIRNESNQKHKYQLDMYSQQLRDAKSRLDMAENEVMKVKHDATKTEQMLRLDHSRVEAKYKTELEVASHRANRLKDEKSRIEAHLLEVQAKQSMYATKVCGIMAVHVALLMMVDFSAE